MQTESKPIRLSVAGKLITVSLIVALTIWLLQHVEHVLTPFFAAFITAYLFNPLVSLLQRRTGAGRWIWVTVLYVLAFTLLYGVGTLILPRIISQYRDLEAQIPVIIADLQRQIQSGQEINIGGLVLDLGPIEQPVVDALVEIGRRVPELVPELVLSAVELVVYVLVYLIVTFYLLLQAEQLMSWIYNLVPAPYRMEIRGLVGEIDQVLGAYVRGQFVLILIMSVVMYIPLSILGIRYALVIAIISGVLEIIPFIGPWSAAGIAISTALWQGHEPFGLSGVSLAALIGGIYLTARLFEDNFIIPTLVGHLVKLHPALVIFSLLAGAALGGAFGLLVAIPVAAVIRILLAYLYRKLVDTPEPTHVTLDPTPPSPSPVPQRPAVPDPLPQRPRKARPATPRQ